ncbi:MAG: succinyl-diaminopimelate desuccinylase [Gammaproteobacteria bacterium]|nr:succinyl-diaminopimelate desuccinylase [Gammaproteobacteria bacterium]
MDDTLSLARTLIRKPSATPDDAGCQEILGERLASLGFTVESMPFGQVSNLWARLGDDAPLVVFAGHTDVVPTGPLASWAFDPFAATIDDGMLYGRGAVDMKSSLAAFVTGIESFLSESEGFQGSIGVLITSDEEGPAVDGTVRVVETLSGRGEHIDYCVVGEPSSSETLGDTIKNGRRGSLSGSLTVHGVQGHVAYPDTADNPVHRFGPALHELGETIWDEGNDHFPPTTFQISSIHAGTGDANNVIPGELRVEFNLRFGTASTPESLKARIESVLRSHSLRYDLQWRLSGEPFLTAEGRLIDAVQRAADESLGITPALSTAGGTSDGRFIAPVGAQVVELGPVNATIHKINECIDIGDPDRLSRVYWRILNHLLR